MMFSTEKFQEAVKKRELLQSGSGSDKLTNAYRLVDGEGDGLPGLIVDNFAGRWLVQTYQSNPPDLDSISGFRSLYWKKLSKTDKTGAPRHLAGELVTEPFEIVENGLRYSIDFAGGYSQGIFLDQRDNRRRLRELAK